MHLFHVSEESNISCFEPRLPTRADLDPNVGLVWAIDEKRLPNFLTPRECPRVTYHIGKNTASADAARFFSSTTMHHTVVIEQGWLDRMRNTTLYLYEFDPAEFTLQDEIAGYYVATTAQYPIQKTVIKDLFAELLARNVELRIVDNLWDIADQVKTSTLNWSLCRMGNAKKR